MSFGAVTLYGPDDTCCYIQAGALYAKLFIYEQGTARAVKAVSISDISTEPGSHTEVIDFKLTGSFYDKNLGCVAKEIIPFVYSREVTYVIPAASEK